MRLEDVVDLGPGATPDEHASHLPDDGTPKEGGSLAWGLEGESDSLNPVTGRWALSGHMVGSAIFDSLTALDADGNVGPAAGQVVRAQRRQHGVDDQPPGRRHVPERPGLRRRRGDQDLNTYKTALITGAAFKVVDTVTPVGPDGR